MNEPVKYRFSPTLLDSFHSYLTASEVYHTFWGHSENPKMSEEEFEQKQFQALIDRLNRKPIAWEDSEAMDRGTAFNEVIDCMILGKKSETMKILKMWNTSNSLIGIEAEYNNRKFQFPIEICRNITNRLKEAIPQVHVQGFVNTKYGNVYMHGYIDELLPFKVVDIKTTSNYHAFKYRNHWQRIVYPYLLNQNGNSINDFEFLVTDFKNVWTEFYTYDEAEDKPQLELICEQLIEFIEANKEAISLGNRQ